MDIKERFMSHVMPEPNSGCWLWDAAHFATGYTRFAKTTNETVLGHRMAYELFCSEIPNNAFVCHKCDNPSCVNPDHLFIGNAKTNMDDKVSKNRQAYGEKIRNLKLTKEQAYEILNSQAAIKELAKMYNVSYGIVWGIKKGKSYKWAKD